MTSPLEQENRLLEAENHRLVQEIARQAAVIRALEQDPGHLHSRMTLPDDADPSLCHVIHGSPEALAHVHALMDFKAWWAALTTTGRKTADQAGAGGPS